MKKKTQRFTLLVSGLIIVLLLVLQWKFELHWLSSADAGLSQNFFSKKWSFSNISKTNSATELPESTSAIDTNINENLIKFQHDKIEPMANKISQLQKNPEVIEKELDHFARSLSEEEISYLYSISSNEKNGDIIALSLDLLGRSDSELANNYLLQYTLEGPKVSTPESSTFQILSLDGVIEHAKRNRMSKNLEQIQNRSQNSFIINRARQATLAIQGLAPFPDESDSANLKELLKKSDTKKIQR